MPAIAGRKSTFEVSADGNTFVHVDGLVDISFAYNVSEIECTKHSTGLSDAGRREFLPNLEDRTFDISCRWLDGDPGQDIILDAATTKTLFYYRFKMDPLTEIPFIGRAFATSISPTGPLDDTAGVDFSLRCTTLGITPALDLQFADDLSLTDQVTGNNLVTFTRATSATYVGADGLIKTAASGEPRFDHDPVTGESLGLLIEEQRTNLTTYSEQFDDASWSKTNTTITANAAIAPDGAMTADKLLETATTTAHYVSPTLTAVTSGTRYTGSYYFKAAEYTFVQLTFSTTSFGTNQYANFNLSTGVVTAEVGGTAKITSAGNGWYRCTFSATCATTDTGVCVAVFIRDGLAGRLPSYAGNASNGLFIWGAQFEVGAFATSYIPTTTAAVTRNHDDVLISGANFSSWYNQNEGSFFAEYQRQFDAKDVGYTNPRIFVVSAGSSFDNRIIVTTATNPSDHEVFAVYTGGVQVVNIELPQAIGANEPVKISAAYKTNDAAASRDGASVLTDSSVNIYTSMNRMRIGNYVTNPASGNYVHNGTIKRLTYYNTRIPNAALQEITIK